MSGLWIFLLIISAYGAGMMIGYFGGYSIAIEDMELESYDTRMIVKIDDQEYIFEAYDYYLELIDSDEKLNATLNLN